MRRQNDGGLGEGAARGGKRRSKREGTRAGRQEKQKMARKDAGPGVVRAVDEYKCAPPDEKVDSVRVEKLLGDHGVFSGQ